MNKVASEVSFSLLKHSNCKMFSELTLGIFCTQYYNVLLAPKSYC